MHTQAACIAQLTYHGHKCCARRIAQQTGSSSVCLTPISLLRRARAGCGEMLARERVPRSGMLEVHQLGAQLRALEAAQVVDIWIVQAVGVRWRCLSCTGKKRHPHLLQHLKLRRLIIMPSKSFNYVLRHVPGCKVRAPDGIRTAGCSLHSLIE